MSPTQIVPTPEDPTVVPTSSPTETEAPTSSIQAAHIMLFPSAKDMNGGATANVLSGTQVGNAGPPPGNDLCTDAANTQGIPCLTQEADIIPFVCSSAQTSLRDIPGYQGTSLSVVNPKYQTLFPGWNDIRNTVGSDNNLASFVFPDINIATSPSSLIFTAFTGCNSDATFVEGSNNCADWQQNNNRNGLRTRGSDTSFFNPSGNDAFQCANTRANGFSEPRVIFRACQVPAEEDVTASPTHIPTALPTESPVTPIPTEIPTTRPTTLAPTAEVQNIMLFPSATDMTTSGPENVLSGSEVGRRQCSPQEKISVPMQ